MEKLPKLTINVKELSELLGISEPSAYNLIKLPGFPAVRLSPRRVVIPLDALNRWLNDPLRQTDAKSEL
jgi:excisionase family DNA binding protein